MVVHTKDERVEGPRARQLLEFTLLNHPDGLPDLRQSRRVHPAETLRREQCNEQSRLDVVKVHGSRNVVDLGPVRSFSTPSAASSATRCIRVCDEVAEVHQLEISQSRRTHSELGNRAPAHATRQPLFPEHCRCLPGGCSHLQGLPVYDAGMGAVHHHRLDLHRAARRAATSRYTTGQRVEPGASFSRATTPRSTSHWMCDEGRKTYHPLTRRRRLAVTWSSQRLCQPSSTPWLSEEAANASPELCSAATAARVVSRALSSPLQRGQLRSWPKLPWRSPRHIERLYRWWPKTPIAGRADDKS